MKNNCPRCEWERVAESLSDRGPREVNQNLLSDLFDLTYKIYAEFQGTYSSISTDYYVDRAKVLEVVTAALDKADRQALDEWRSQKRLQKIQ